MSYFAAGFYTKADVLKDFECSFIDVLPQEISKDVLKINGRGSFLLNYGSNKVINDIVIQNNNTGAWLILLGTPIIKLQTEESKLFFLDTFFKDPKGTLKEELDGCFALIAYDATCNKFFAATDYNNTTPIYYSITPEGIYLCSHELQLARQLQPEIDPLGFSMTIQLKLTWGVHTRFKNIHKLLPCHIMTGNADKNYRSEPYWQPKDERQWPPNFDDVAAQWLSLLKPIVNNYYECAINKNNILCDFTAGEDSRLLLAQLHALGISFKATVIGLGSDMDVKVAKEAAQKIGFELIIRDKYRVTEEQILRNAIYISLMHDAYQDYFQSCADFATAAAQTFSHYKYVQYGGAPGGEAFRGSYYLRGKAIFPSSHMTFDYRFFTRMKYLLDFHPGLLNFPDEEFKKTLLTLVEQALAEVSEFPVGIKIDHLLRLFQTCNAGLIYKNPRYLPFAAKNMTRSIYNVPPHIKRGGKLTKACTEMLYPELAAIKTQKGVPTMRKTLGRTLLFLPEYVAQVKSIMRGAVSRLFKWTDSNKSGYKWSENASTIMTLFNKPPYAEWFSSSKSMLTGYLYNSKTLDDLLTEAKAGSSRYVPILGRIINQELACRWVYNKQ